MPADAQPSEEAKRLVCPECGNGGTFSTPYFTCPTCIYGCEREAQALERDRDKWRELYLEFKR